MNAANTLVLASGNSGKLKEFNQLLSPLGLDVRPQAEFDVHDVEETGLTFVENALLKAREASRVSGLPARRRLRSGGRCVAWSAWHLLCSLCR